MPPLIIVGAMTTSVAIFVLVSASESLDVQTAIISENMVLIGLAVILVVFHLALKIFEESKSMLRSQIWCRGNSSFLLHARCRRVFQKYWRSFPCLKIYFFQGNFFESSTPLVILDFSMSCAVNLLLLKN